MSEEEDFFNSINSIPQVPRLVLPNQFDINQHTEEVTTTYIRYLENLANLNYHEFQQQQRQVASLQERVELLRQARNQPTPPPSDTKRDQGRSPSGSDEDEQAEQRHRNAVNRGLFSNASGRSQHHQNQSGRRMPATGKIIRFAGEGKDNDWIGWRVTFEETATFYEWSVEQSRSALRIAMHGRASQVTRHIDISTLTQKQALDKFEEVFLPPCCSTDAMVKFKQAVQEE